MCVAGTCECLPGRERCGDNCVDLSAHALHCGGCDRRCDEGARCSDGQCSCFPGRESCNGVCLVFDSDENCGACGNACPERTECRDAACRCNDGFGTLCDDLCVDLRTDEDNCGECGTACVVGARCLGSECACRGQNPATCDDRCVDLDADAFHCGRCGASCGPGQDCDEGTCRCQGVLETCGDECADLGSDANHCGVCGRACGQGELCCAGECFGGAECPERPLDVVCADTVDDIPFHVSEASAGWLLSAWVPDGTIALQSIRTPAAQVSLSAGDYRFARRGTDFLDTVHPLLLPMAPEFADLVVPGSHTASLRASGAPCYAVASASGVGTTVRIRLLLTDIPGLDAASGRTDPRLSGALARANLVLRQAGVELVVDSYEDAETGVATRYAVIREIDEVFELVSTSPWPGLTPDARLILNVYVIRVFTVPAGGEILGVSAGIPGAAGVHGTASSGVVVSIRDDTQLLGNVLAHEIGHFLGLFHTTEVYATGFDPLGDTAQCPRDQWSDPLGCPGSDNLMFPYAVPTAQNLTPDQRSVVRVNPLVR